MRVQILRHDIEGDLIQYTDSQPSQFGKRLPLDVAWHIVSPDDIGYSLERLVESVHQDFAKNLLDIIYKPTITPLNLQQLREIVRLDKPLALWRLVKLMVDLCEALKELHTAEIPQLLIHPERVGQLGEKFVLMPTLAGILPPLSNMPSNDIAGWLHYVAPEVLRTRGNDIRLLEAGDIYSMGRMLEVLVMTQFEPSGDVPHDLAEKLVVSRMRNLSGEWPVGFERLSTLATKMCGFLPEDRPPLDEILLELRAIAGQAEPESHIRHLIDQNLLTEAAECLKELQITNQQGVFDFPSAKIFLLRADLALAQSPPAYAKAIGYLDKGLSFEPKSVLINLKLAQTYSLYKTNEQHLSLSSHYYAQAAELSNWREDIVVAWSNILQQFNEPKKVLYQTQSIPADRRTPNMFLLRAQGYLEAKKYSLAWQETIHYFEKHGFAQDVYEVARSASEHIEPLTLLRWMHQHQGASALDGPMALVWARNGNVEKATECLTRALLTQQRIEGNG